MGHSPGKRLNEFRNIKNGTTIRCHDRGYSVLAVLHLKRPPSNNALVIDVSGSDEACHAFRMGRESSFNWDYVWERIEVFEEQ